MNEFRARQFRSEADMAQQPVINTDSQKQHDDLMSQTLLPASQPEVEATGAPASARLQ